MESSSPNYQCKSVSNETSLTLAFAWTSLYFVTVLHILQVILYKWGNTSWIVLYAIIPKTESPKNSNNIIFNTDYYGHPVSGRSYPWCCVFVWDIYRMCNASKYYYGGKKTASCTTLLNWYKKNRPAFVHKDITKMRHGDLVFYQFDSDPSADHIGIFDCAINAKSFYAIEGNTSSGNRGSQDDGDGVYRRVRKICC